MAIGSKVDTLHSNDVVTHPNQIDFSALPDPAPAAAASVAGSAPAAPGPVASESVIAPMVVEQIASQITPPVTHHEP